MTTNPSSKLPEVFVLIILQVIRIHEWEVVVVFHPRTPRGMRILIIPQVIRIHFGEWEVVIVYGPRRGVKILKDIAIIV
jgi:hypothetical protein